MDHYRKTSIQAIDAIREWKLAFCLGNAVKYIARHEHKGSGDADLLKAVWYLVYHITEDGEFCDKVMSEIRSKHGVTQRSN